MSAESVCAAITRKHARTFTAASRFLPPEKRRASFAVYAFCRVADDIVDEDTAPADVNAGAALAAHRQMLDAVVGAATLPSELDAAEPVTPLVAVSQELRWAMRRFGIPATPFHDLLDAIESDLVPAKFETWTELSRYCGGVASTVGEMCAYVFGVRAGHAAEALQHARTLGVALQLTNILRDVGEDAGRGRCYLPAEDLAAHGLSRTEILEGTVRASDERWRALMRFEIARARALYEASAPGLELIDRDARCCGTICARGYAAILDAIERRDYDSLSGRARIGAVRKGAIAIRAWIGARTTGEGLRADPVRGGV